MQNLRQILQSNSLFSTLPEQELTEILKRSTNMKIGKDQFLIHEREKNGELFLLLDGLARSVLINEEGQEETIHFYRAGEVIGLLHHFSGEPVLFSVQTADDCELLILPKKEFHQLLQKYNLFAEKLTIEMSRRLQTLVQSLAIESSQHPRGLETYPYRKKVGDLMTRPAISVDEETSIMAAAQLMIDRKISSLLVTKNGELRGIVTEHDLFRMIPCFSSIPSSTVRDLMSSHLVTISAESYFYEAMLKMVNNKIKHLPVVTEGKLEGIITLKNLSDFRGHSILTFVEKIEEACSIESLGNINPSILSFVYKMKQQLVPSEELCSILSDFNDRILRKIIQLKEQEMVDEGFGSPPVDYCWIAMGSEGRKEQTIATDQDNGIIYADIENEEEQEQIDHYFAILAEKIVSSLEKIGVPRCKGDVMATNPHWRKSLSSWKDTLRNWFSYLQLDDIRQFTIFLDFRPIYGNFNLAKELRDFLFLEKRKHPLVYPLLVEDDAGSIVPLGLFGRILFDKKSGETLDLKSGALVHFVNVMRILSLLEGIEDVSTVQRLTQLAMRGIFTQEEKNEILHSFQHLIDLRLQLHLEQIQQKKDISNLLSVSKLAKNERIQLKKSLITAKWLQQRLFRMFQVKGIRI